MPLSARKLFPALNIVLLLAPFGLFFIVLANSPGEAGFLAGAGLARLMDPVIMLGVFSSVFVGYQVERWVIGSFAIGMLTGLVGTFFGFSWWREVAGEAGANHNAVLFLLFSSAFCIYGALAGRTARLLAGQRPK